MHSRSISAAAVLLFGSVLLAQSKPVEPAPKSVTQEQIKKAVEELASPRFAVRERASKLLWESGSQAEDALQAAAGSKDEETANRAKAILEKFSWGLYPDTPEAIATAIGKFRGGDPDVRRMVIGELIVRIPTPFSTVRKLIAHEENDENRTEMYRAMIAKVRHAAPALILAGKTDELDSLLELCSSDYSRDSYVDFAALHFLRGTTAAAIARMEPIAKQGAGAERKRAAEALVHLHRTRNDWPAARRAAAIAKNKDLDEKIAWESNDWKWLAERELEPGEDEDRGARAAYHRLAGNPAKFDEIMGELRKELQGVEGDDNAAYRLAVSLLLNGRGADAISLLKERPNRGASLTFDMLCAQLKFKEAFALADKAIKEYEKDAEGGVIFKAELDLERAKVLAGLGDRDGATQIFRSAFQGAGLLNRTRNGVDVIKSIIRAGMYDLAAECTARLLGDSDANEAGLLAEMLLEPLFGEQRFAAHAWWSAYRLEKADEEPSKVLNRMQEFASRKADKPKAEQLIALIEKLRKRIADGKDVPDAIVLMRTNLDYAIAEVYRAVGVNDKAEEHYKAAISAKEPKNLRRELLDNGFDDEPDAGPVPSTFRYVFAYADFLLSLKRYKEAAENYRAAWELAPARPLPLFMAGFTTKQAGNAKEGERLMSLAHWIPLGSDSSRSQFSEDLSSRGFDQDSLREMEIMLSTAWFQTFQYGNAMVRQARIKARKKDYAAAAMLYDKDVVGLTRSGAMFIEKRAYLTVPELARTYRVQASLAAGQLDAALAETRIGLEALPANVELAIAIVPDLEKAGKKKEADEIYGKVRSAFDAAIKDFSNSADLRNSLAWTMVNCNRDLETALKHSEQAVKLVPRSAGYVDTLAEIHFRLKDRTKALELMKQCAALEPRNPYYRKQLERFEKKAFDSPLPDEETGDD